MSFDELREAGIEFPASIVSELELAGAPIERCYRTGGAGERRVACVRISPAADLGAGPTAPSSQQTTPDPGPTAPASQQTTPDPGPTAPASQHTTPDPGGRGGQLWGGRGLALGGVRPGRSARGLVAPARPKAKTETGWQPRHTYRMPASLALVETLVAGVAWSSSHLKRRWPRVVAPVAVAAVAALIAVVLLARSATSAHRGHTTAARHGLATSTSASHRTSTRAAKATASSKPPPTTATRPHTPPTPVSPALATSLEARGHALLQAGRYRDAAPILKRALQATGERPGSCLEPTTNTCLTYAYALYDLGRTLRLGGDPAAAIPILERRLRIDNQRPAVAAELGRARRQTG